MLKIIILMVVINSIYGEPYDDGKYYPQKYNTRSNDDGKYYRSLDEGKYVPGDEGRYSYIYRQGIYPADEGDYRYIHQEGPSGGNTKYIHQQGPNGKPGSDNDYYEPAHLNKYYLNNKIYAEKYKHFRGNNWVQGIVDKYVPFYNTIASAQSEDYFRSVSPESFQDFNVLNCTKLWDDYNISTADEKLLSIYNVQGERAMNSFGKKFKLLYQVFVKIYDC